MTKHDVEGLDPELKRLWDAIGNIQSTLADSIGHEREMREQDRQALAKALELQAIENDRHFDVLNHAHSNAIETAGRTVPREIFDNYQNDMTTWRRTVEEALSKQSGAAAEAALVNQRRNALLAIGLAIFALLLRFVPLGTT